MRFFSSILAVYIVYCLSVIAHELAHLICAKIMHLHNVDIRIGERFLAVNIRHFHFSPLIIGGSVEVDSDTLLRKKKWQIIMFYLSGSMANLLIIIVALIVMPYIRYPLYVIFANLFFIVMNLFPIKTSHNDFGECVSALKEGKGAMLSTKNG